MPTALSEAPVLQNAAEFVSAQRQNDASHFDFVLLNLINAFRDGSFASDPGVILNAQELGRLAAQFEFGLPALTNITREERVRLSNLSKKEDGREELANELLLYSRPQVSWTGPQSFYFSRYQVERVAIISFALAGGL